MTVLDGVALAEPVPVGLAGRGRGVVTEHAARAGQRPRPHEHGDDGADDLLVAARPRRPGLQDLLPSCVASLLFAVALDRHAGPPAPCAPAGSSPPGP